MPRRRSIHDRDPIVEKRARIGDLEIDTIIGKRHRQSIKEATIELLTSIKPWLKTITADNGKEFSQHESITKALAIDFYFADPYASWQRGSNENTNGLVRQYIPKGFDFDHYSDADIEAIMNRLNNLPRKRLGFKSPSQVLLKNLGVAL